MKKKNKKKFNPNIIIIVVLICIISIMTIGFAGYNKLLTFSGNAILNPQGKLEVTNIRTYASSNVISSEIPTIDENNNINLNINFGGTEEETFITYEVTLVNNSSYDFIFNELSFNPTIRSASGKTGIITYELDGISENDIIKTKEEKTFNIKFILDREDPNENYEVTIEANVDANTNPSGSIASNLQVTNNDLRENKKGRITVNLINTYNKDITFTINSSSSNIKVVDSNGNDIPNMTLHANSEESFNAYLMVSDDAIFTTNNTQTTIYISTNGLGNYTVSKVDLLVDIKEAKDETIPEIGPVTIIRESTNHEATVTFSRLDTGGTNITNYTILLYNSTNNQLVNTYNTNSDITTFTMTNVDEGTYYVVVYGEDEAGNTGRDEISNNSTTNVHARRSEPIRLKWIASIKRDLTNLNSSNTNDEIAMGTTYETTLTATGFLNSVPDTINVTMGGTPLTQGSDYTYNNGKLTIPNVSDNIVITATANNGCLVEGTKIRIKDGKYKNVEDITYNDLLEVWSYDEGKLENVYPVWIEKEHTTKDYIEITFSDNTKLNIFGRHGIFNADLNLFVNVVDKENFYVGMKTYKVINNKLTEVTITNIKEIKKKVNYYHIVSNRYYNVIANDVITTDGEVLFSNLYGFNENIVWPEIRNTLEQANAFYTNDEVNVLPHYMFKGLRAGEGKVLQEYMSLEEFNYYMKTTQLNQDMLREVDKDNKGNRLFMVTTSFDIVNALNKNSFLQKENSNYIVPNPKIKKKFKYYINTTDRKIYYPNDKIKVDGAIYLKAIYK